MSAAEIRTALHLRTGLCARVAAVDTWLAQHKVRVTTYDDVYIACVHLLQHGADMPDVVAVGADWLTPDEFHIVPYIRQTWPHTVILVYGGECEQPGFDALPLTRTYAREDGLRTMLAEPPGEHVRRLRAHLPLFRAPPLPRAPVAPPAEAARSSLPGRDGEAPPPRAILTAEELAALLDDRGEE